MLHAAQYPSIKFEAIFDITGWASSPGMHFNTLIHCVSNVLLIQESGTSSNKGF